MENPPEDEVKESVGSSEDPPLSKRQLKRQARLAKWDDKKREKRTKERQKIKDKKAKGEFVRNGPSRKALKLNKPNPDAAKFSVVVDLSFDEKMNDKDLTKCAKQLLRVYTLNRRSSQPVPLYFAGLNDGSKCLRALQRNEGYQNWDVTFTEQHYLQLGFDKSKIVYLTAESDCVLTELEAGLVYIIGGLVDHNQYKGFCHQKAEEAGVRTARLPLSEHISMKTRTVLTIVHVFELLVKIAEGKDWTSALLEVLPARKGAQPKADGKGKDDDS